MGFDNAFFPIFIPIILKNNMVSGVGVTIYVNDVLSTGESGIVTSSHTFEKNLFMDDEEKSNWLNERFHMDDDERIRKGLTRTVFKLPQITSVRRVPW